MGTVGTARSKDACSRSANILPAAGGGSRRPPMMPRTASGFSGRRFCRIFPNGDVWMLRVERGGWELTAEPEDQKTFPTLAAAISYAVANAFSYRVVHALGNKNTGEDFFAGDRSAAGCIPATPLGWPKSDSSKVRVGERGFHTRAAGPEDGFHRCRPLPPCWDGQSAFRKILEEGIDGAKALPNSSDGQPIWGPRK